MPMMMSSLHDAFDYAARRTPNAAAAVCRGEVRQVLSYAALRERSLLLAAGLATTPALCAGERPSGGDAIRVAAIWLPRTHPDFVPLIVAFSRVGVPFVMLSTDLPDKGLERARNVQIFDMLRPHICVVPVAGGSIPICDGHASTTMLSIGDLEASRPSLADLGAARASARMPEANVLCVLFTGGSQRTKVVQVTHAMILHERATYSEIYQPKSARTCRVLAHTSVYWGASAIGQLSIALAYGGVAVWSEATEVGDLQRCIREESVTVLGLVPDHLDILAP